MTDPRSDKKLPVNAGHYINMKAGRKVTNAKSMKWLSDTNLSVKNISPFFQVGNTVKHETSALYREAKDKKLMAAKTSFCKKMKLGLGAKQIKAMPYIKIRALGLAALIKAKKNGCEVCGETVDNLTEGQFRATRIYHHMCAAKADDEYTKKNKQIRMLLWLHNHKGKNRSVII